MNVTRVELGARSYDVHVGRGLLDRVGTLVDLAGAGHVAIVTQEPVARHHLAALLAGLGDVATSVHEVPDGEVAKAPSVLTELWRAFAQVPLSRRDVVVALGGGVVGDLAGFAAATYNRGIDVVQVPTTVLAQVDASVGGKTGIDLPEGKNLVGAFLQPRAVVADTATLDTLPRRERIAGLGEVVKYGFIRDPEVLDLLERDPDAATGGDPALLEELVRRSVAVKAAVVAADERESGEREHLNFGHTFGHAVESLTGYDTFLHGEAVAIGAAVALRLGVDLGVTDDGLVERHDALCRRLGLPTRAPALDRDEVWRAMGRDKKVRDGVRFVLVERPGRVRTLAPDRAAVDRSIDAVTDA